MALLLGTVINMKHDFRPTDFVILEVLTENEWRKIRCRYSRVERTLAKIYRENRVRGSMVSLDKNHFNYYG